MITSPPPCAESAAIALAQQLTALTAAAVASMLGLPPCPSATQRQAAQAVQDDVALLVMEIEADDERMGLRRRPAAVLVKEALAIWRLQQRLTHMRALPYGA